VPEWSAVVETVHSAAVNGPVLAHLLKHDSTPM
jgi:hypothetical protein